jgi:hypothetical protein
MTNIELEFMKTMISQIREISNSLRILAENDTKRLKYELKELRDKKI